MSKILTKEQRLCFAIKACHMMGYDAEKAADLLETDLLQVRAVYGLIEKGYIDFNSK